MIKPQAGVLDNLSGKVVVVGIGNTLRSDDGIGSLVAARINGKTPFLVFDSGINPENYLGKIIGENPATVVIVDAVDFGGRPGEIRVLEPKDFKTSNLFCTHNASISVVINFLQENLPLDIIILAVQPKSIVFGDKLSPEVTLALSTLENWFYLPRPSFEAGRELKDGRGGTEQKKR